MPCLPGSGQKCLRALLWAGVRQRWPNGAVGPGPYKPVLAVGWASVHVCANAPVLPDDALRCAQGLAFACSFAAHSERTGCTLDACKLCTL